MMNLFILEKQYLNAQGRKVRMLVRAPGEDEARLLAGTILGGLDGLDWLDRSHVTCRAVDAAGLEPEVIIMGFKP